MIVTFFIDDKPFQINLREHETIHNIKNILKQKFFPSSNKWLMLSYMGDRPLREFGKQDLIPGNVPLSMDHKRLSDFSIRNDVNYTFSVHEIELQQNNVVDNLYKLNSLFDFPNLL